jgi:hypothetical protein
MKLGKAADAPKAHLPCITQEFHGNRGAIATISVPESCPDDKTLETLLAGIEAFEGRPCFKLATFTWKVAGMNKSGIANRAVVEQES